MDLVLKAVHPEESILYDVILLDIPVHQVVLNSPGKPEPMMIEGGHYPFDYYFDLRKFSLLVETGREGERGQPIYQKIYGRQIEAALFPEISIEQ